MSVCSCYFEGTAMGVPRGPHRARKSGFECPLCDRSVDVGTLCVDLAYLYDEPGEGGGFARCHHECWELMRLWYSILCDGGVEWSFEFNVDAAADEAFAVSDRPEYRLWLELYEQTWEDDE